MLQALDLFISLITYYIIYYMWLNIIKLPCSFLYDGDIIRAYNIQCSFS